jgi:hypothetical protein
MQVLVIFFRFGCVITDNRARLSTSEVFKLTGVKLSTQNKLIARLRMRDYLIMYCHREGRNGTFTS